MYKRQQIKVIFQIFDVHLVQIVVLADKNNTFGPEIFVREVLLDAIDDIFCFADIALWLIGIIIDSEQKINARIVQVVTVFTGIDICTGNFICFPCPVGKLADPAAIC